MDVGSILDLLAVVLKALTILASIVTAIIKALDGLETRIRDCEGDDSATKK